MATENICQSMGDKTVSYDTAIVWFKEFREGRFCLQDKPEDHLKSILSFCEVGSLFKRFPPSTMASISSNWSTNNKR